jgi:hypothetical protein
MAWIQRAVKTFKFTGHFLHQQVKKQVNKVEREGAHLRHNMTPSSPEMSNFEAMSAVHILQSWIAEMALIPRAGKTFEFVVLRNIEEHG